jgi:putative transposase
MSTCLAHKIALEPTSSQRLFFEQAAGTARFTYNWALAEWQELSASDEKPKGHLLKKSFNALRRVQFPWTYDVHRDATAQPFADLQKAFVNFWKGNAEYPRFKKKGKSRDSFYVANDKCHVIEKTVILPKVGAVKMRESLRFDGKILGATVSREADRWAISIQVELLEDYCRTRTADGQVGVDLGIKHLATLSTGEVVDGPKPLKQGLKQLKRANRVLHRRKKGSANRKKAQQRVAKVHARITHVRNDSLHKLTSELCRENQAISIEDLHVKGLIKNPHLSRAISDMGWGECRRQLEYKAPFYDSQLHIIGRFEPSSKMCHRCKAAKKVLSLGERLFVCNACGHIADRDINAAKNINQLGQALPEVTPVESRALVMVPIMTKLISRKQERTRAYFCARER